MSNAVFLRPDENGNWGSVSIIGSGATGEIVSNSSDAVATSSTNQAVASYNYGFNGTTWDRLRTVNTGQVVTTIKNSTGTEISLPSTALADGGSFSFSGVAAIVNNFGYTGAGYDRIRVGKVYKHIEYLALGAGASTTVWTPASGKKFRLMGISVAIGGSGRLTFNDGAAGTPFHAVRTNTSDTQAFYFGNGYLSLTANNVVEVKNTGAAGVDLWVTAWGTEE